MRTLPEPSFDGTLPIHSERVRIEDAIREHPVLILAGETGSGKTTQLPKFLLSMKLGQRGVIGCTQPRRVAALAVADRIAEELGVEIGGSVGAKIRFADQTSEETVIKVMTDGILLNEIERDPLLKQYEALMIDEAHERNLNIDFILGHLSGLIKKRKDLKVIITSATIDTERFSKAFSNAPVIEVEGRTYPVKTHYRPIREAMGEPSYAEAIVNLTREILEAKPSGDILVFLPTERDIRELKAHLEAEVGHRCDVLPLFGRLTQAEQRKIFTVGGRRRIVLSTNIAETSLTVPGIRYVIDSGLARVSRYSPFTRTRRLPIEQIAQSSAEQRKGRCGRLAAGECFRLYDEADFAARPPFPSPEIQRTNLASVILRLMAFRLGNVEDFPFLDPPPENAIRGAYRLLEEIGAIVKSADGTKRWELTRIGEQIARLPVDPSVARMLIAGVAEGVSETLLVIASGLSVQDPRERPAEAAALADAAHRTFADPESDFLSLVKIWDSFHEKKASKSQNQLRKYCKAHFLNYQRMREWRDIHSQLARVLRTLNLPQTTAPTSKQDIYQAVHRAILAGNLSNIARKERGHTYCGTRARKAMLFPGSGLYDREKTQRPRGTDKTAPLKTRSPEWIVCGEWMETNQLYARCAARIEPEWAIELAGGLVQERHSEPRWSERSQRVLCLERKLLFGLELIRKKVGYAKINPPECSLIFVQEGLMGEGIRENLPFLEQNRSTLQKAIAHLAKSRTGSPQSAEDKLRLFYESQIPPGIGSIADLRRHAKTHHNGSLDYLKVSDSYLRPTFKSADAAAYPEDLNLGGIRLPLEYRHNPGQADDGVTVCLSPGQLNMLASSTLDWAVPGHLPTKVEALLRSLPKAKRKRLHPIADKINVLVGDMQQSTGSLLESLSAVLQKKYDLVVYPDEWDSSVIPEYLKPRIEVKNRNGEMLTSGRNPSAIKAELHKKGGDKHLAKNDVLPEWKEAQKEWEHPDLRTVAFHEIPEKIEISKDGWFRLYAWPGLLKKRSGAIGLVLFTNQRDREGALHEAWGDLCFAKLGRDAAWIERDLEKEMRSLGALKLALHAEAWAKEKILGMVQRHLFGTAADLVYPITETRVNEVLTQAKESQKGLVYTLFKQLSQVLQVAQEVRLLLDKKKTPQAIVYPGMRRQLEALTGVDFFEVFEVSEISNLQRYLRAMIVRAERAKQNLARDMERAKLIAPWEAILPKLKAQCETRHQRAHFKRLYLATEEYRVSVFAQELGTAQKISPKRLETEKTAVESAIRETFKPDH